MFIFVVPEHPIHLPILVAAERCAVEDHQRAHHFLVTAGVAEIGVANCAGLALREGDETRNFVVCDRGRNPGKVLKNFTARQFFR